MTASTPTVVTPALLASIRRHPNLPRHTWYFIAATTLSMLNRPDEIPKVYKYAIDSGSDERDAPPSPDEQLSISRRMREALIKASAVGGLPKTINALLELKKETPPHLLDESPGFSPTSRAADIYDVPPAQILQRGQSFFDKVYAKVAKRVMGQMDRSGTEDLGLAARLLYGHLLSNTSVLSAAETSFVLIAGLIPQDVNPQLKGHLRGAINGGATVEEVRAVRNVVIQICQASGMRMLEKGALGGWGWRNEVADL
ncbi:AhpD-like protein [Pleurostoma richardsiae]|uniref:AhpD-like protein n=1 Tax=Pleurostoma richardsiae TaxID=41990 RepID=A0AA38RP11_9PEZI|nr:AhpD-like protein [Pleurostoma richardsiae]